MEERDETTIISPNFELWKLKRKIRDLRVDRYGELRQDGQFSLSQFFTSPHSLSKMENWPISDSIIDFYISGISQRSSLFPFDVHLSSTVARIGWLFEDNEGQRDFYSMTLSDPWLRSAITTRVKTLQIHLLWEGFFTAFDHEFWSSGLKFGDLLHLLMWYRTGQNSQILLQDWLLQETEYGRVVAEFRFEDAATILGRNKLKLLNSSRPVSPVSCATSETELPSQLRDMKLKSNTLVSELLQIFRIAIEVRRSIISVIRDPWSPSPYLEIAAVDPTILEILVEVIESHKSKFRGRGEREGIAICTNLPEVRKLMREIEEDLRLNLSYYVASMIWTSERTTEIEESQNFESQILRWLGLRLENRKYQIPGSKSLKYLEGLCQSELSGLTEAELCNLYYKGLLGTSLVITAIVYRISTDFMPKHRRSFIFQKCKNQYEILSNCIESQICQLRKAGTTPNIRTVIESLDRGQLADKIARVKLQSSQLFNRWLASEVRVRHINNNPNLQVLSHLLEEKGVAILSEDRLFMCSIREMISASDNLTEETGDPLPELDFEISWFKLDHQMLEALHLCQQLKLLKS